MSTLASSNIINNREMTLLYSDDESEDLQGNLVKSSKPSYSPERKMSSEDDKILLPKAQDSNLLRAPSKFASNLTLSSKSEQSVKPMSILGFLQNSTKSVLQYDSKKFAKANFLSQTTLSLISGSSNSGDNISSFTLG